MKKVEIKGVVKMYSDGIASSYTQLLNIIAIADDIEGIKQRIIFLLEFSVVSEYFAMKISHEDFTIWQCDRDEELTEILTVKFK